MKYVKTTIAMCLFFWVSTSAQIQLDYEEGYSLTHDECIAAYQLLEDSYGNCKLEAAGTSDSGRPIHLFTLGDMSK